MKERDYTGEWHLPFSTKKYPGRLHIDPEGRTIELSLFGQEAIEGVTVTDRPSSNEPQYSHEVILGDCRTYVTLLHCSLFTIKEIGKGLYQISYRAEFVFEHGQVDDLNTPFILSANYIFPFLASWYDGWRSVGKVPLDDTPYVFSLEEKAAHGQRSLQEAEPVRVKVNDMLSLVFFERFIKSTKEIGVHKEIRYQKYLAFEYTTAVTFNQLLTDAATFLKLLEFSFARPLDSKLLTLQSTKQYLKGKELPLYPTSDRVELWVTNYSLRTSKKTAQHGLHQHQQLISRWTLEKEEVDEVIRTWFANESFYTMYDYYIDSHNWFQESDVVLSNVMFNNRFLNIVQALEDYYRKTLSVTQPDAVDFQQKKGQVLLCIKDPELKRWANNHLRFSKHLSLEKKLQHLLEAFKDIVTELFGTHALIHQFPSYAAQMRNLLSHGNNKQTSQGVLLELHFKIGQVLLAVCILKTLNINLIPKRLEKFHKLQKDIYFIRSVRLSRDQS